MLFYSPSINQSKLLDPPSLEGQPRAHSFRVSGTRRMGYLWTACMATQVGIQLLGRLLECHFSANNSVFIQKPFLGRKNRWVHSHLCSLSLPSTLAWWAQAMGREMAELPSSGNCQSCWVKGTIGNMAAVWLEYHVLSAHAAQEGHHRSEEGSVRG